MQDQRTYFMPYERRRGVEAAVLALTLAEDWPWRVGELAQRLRIPEDVIGLSTATLRADGLLIPHGESLRASWAAVRGDELAGWHSTKRRIFLPQPGSEIALSLAKVNDRSTPPKPS